MNDSAVTGANVLIVSNESNSTQFNLPDNRATTATVYAINKGPNYIGLTTTVGLSTFTDGLYFRSGGSDNAEYLLKNNPSQVIGDVDRIITTVSASSTHGLRNNDVITLGKTKHYCRTWNNCCSYCSIQGNNKIIVNQSCWY